MSVEPQSLSQPQTPPRRSTRKRERVDFYTDNSGADENEVDQSQALSSTSFDTNVSNNTKRKRKRKHSAITPASGSTKIALKSQSKSLSLSSSRRRRSTRLQSDDSLSPTSKKSDEEYNNSIDGDVDSNDNGNVNGKNFERRHSNSPTSTAKPSRVTSPARKRSRKTATGGHALDSNSNNNTGIGTNVDTPSNEMTAVVPLKKRGRGRPRKYPQPDAPSPPKTAPSPPKKGTRTSARTRIKESPTSTSEKDQHVSPSRKSSRTQRKRSLEIQESSIGNKSHAHPASPNPLNSTTDMATSIQSPKPDYNWKQDILFDLQRRVRLKADRYGFFSRPVDPERDECPDYYEIVHPDDAMCFDDIHARIQGGEIGSVEEYVELVQRIVDCAKLYNSDEENFVRKQVDMLIERVELVIQHAKDRWKEREMKEKKLKLKIEKENMRAKNRKEERSMSGSRPRRRSRSRSIDYNDDDINSEGSEDYDKPTKSHSNLERSSRRSSPQRSASLRSSSRLKDRDNVTGQKNKVVASSRSLRLNRTEVVYIDDDSIGSLSDSDLLPQSDDDDLECGPIEGSEIPFCRPMLAGSVMTPCNSREEWLELCPKLATICNEAARRSTLRTNQKAKRYEKPLSEIYMRERIEYDDPLEGFVVRTKAEPHHIQGFIIVTKFTTWRKTFRWDTDNPAALITPTDHRLHLTDKNCELTKELQKAIREGPDASQGYKYPKICEVSLLGGLGCGGSLLSRSLSELRQSQKYDYVVLQSTKIAIPFYEKHGFVRVGAVTRFNDVEACPEVAYRHWSEIVNGEAVEASYMMARRLKSTRGDSLTNIARVKNVNISAEGRKKEIFEALKSAYSLLSDVLKVRIGSVSYTNSYREILSAAREYAISADDYNLVKVIDRAKSEFTGSHFGMSKRILRSELRHGSSSIYEEIINDEEDDLGTENDPNLSNAQGRRSSDVKVHIRFESSEGEGVDLVNASVPNNFLSNDDFFPVKVVVNGERFQLFSDDSDDLTNSTQKIMTARLDRSLKSSEDFIEASILSVENLKSVICKRSSSNSKVDDCGIGDEIMIRIDAFDGSPLWVNATVKKRCKMNYAPHYSGNNGYLVEWEDSGSLKYEKRVLDVRNRGVGRSWCTAIDWASFSVLPLDVLDSLLIGSKVKYPDVDGLVIDGMVVKRIAFGLEDEYKFQVDIGRKSMKGTSQIYQYEHLEAGAIREAIHITDSHITQTRSFLRKYQFPNRVLKVDGDDDHETQPDPNPKQTRKLKILSAGAWADYRLEQYNLTQISENEKNFRKKKCNKVDDCIIHLSTGIGAKASKIPSIPADNKVIEKKQQLQEENAVMVRNDSTSDKQLVERKRKQDDISLEDDAPLDMLPLPLEKRKDDPHITKKRRRINFEYVGDATSLRRSSRTRVNVL